MPNSSDNRKGVDTSNPDDSDVVDLTDEHVASADDEETDVREEDSDVEESEERPPEEDASAEEDVRNTAPLYATDRDDVVDDGEPSGAEGDESADEEADEDDPPARPESVPSAAIVTPRSSPSVTNDDFDTSHLDETREIPSPDEETDPLEEDESPSELGAVDSGETSSGMDDGSGDSELNQTIQMHAVDRLAISEEGRFRELSRTRLLTRSLFAPEIVVAPPQMVVKQWRDGLPEMPWDGEEDDEGDETEPQVSEEGERESSAPTETVEDDEPEDVQEEPSPPKPPKKARSAESTPKTPPSAKPPPPQDPADEGEEDSKDSVKPPATPPQPRKAKKTSKDYSERAFRPTPRAADSVDAHKSKARDKSEQTENGLTPPPTLPFDGGLEDEKVDWLDEVFSELYLRTIPRNIQQITEREADFIEASLGVEQNTRLLDLACGYGRHSLTLAKRGWEMVGFDRSEALLEKASGEAERRSLDIEFLQGDMRSMDFERDFGACICWNGSFGYFSDRTNAEILRRINRSLDDGGELLLDIPNRDFVIRDMPHRVWWEGRNCVFLEEGEFDFQKSVLHMKRSFIWEDGTPPVEHDYYIRLYTLHEMRQLMRLSGFAIEQVSGELHYPGYFLGPSSSRLLIHARKTSHVG